MGILMCSFYFITTIHQNRNQVSHQKTSFSVGKRENSSLAQRDSTTRFCADSFFSCHLWRHARWTKRKRDDLWSTKRKVMLLDLIFSAFFITRFETSCLTFKFSTEIVEDKKKNVSGRNKLQGKQ